MQSVIILGAGTMALEVADILQDINYYEVIGYAVSTEPKTRILNHRPVYKVDELEQFVKKAVKCLRGIYSPDCLDFVADVEYMGFEFISAIHPSASISKTSEIFPGVIINRLVAIGSHTTIRPHVLINRGVTIGHHNTISDGVTIGPGANIAGNVFIGRKALIGMGVNVIENSDIEPSAFIKAGSVYKRN